jgi:hypothetical protein
MIDQPLDTSAPASLPSGEGNTPALPSPAAEVVLPGEPAPSEPPADPYQPEWSDGECQEQALSIGMGPGELRQSYTPAREVFGTFHAEPLMESLEEAGLVSPSDGIRALGKFGDDRRVWREAHARLFGTLPKGAAVTSAPLTGPALEAALDAMVSRYLPASCEKLKAAGVLQSRTFREVAIPIAQEHHRYTTSLPALEKAAKDHQATQAAARGREALARVAVNVQAMSEGEFETQMSTLYDALTDANRHGRDTEALKSQILTGYLQPSVQGVVRRWLPLASIASRVKTIEQELNPEPIIHVFEFVGFQGEGAPSSRTERWGPKGECLVYLEFEPAPGEADKGLHPMRSLVGPILTATESYPRQ